MFNTNQESRPTVPAREIGFFKFLEDSSKMKKIVHGLQIPLKKPSWSVDAFLLPILHHSMAYIQAAISLKNSTQIRSSNLYQINLIFLAKGATSLSLNYCRTVAKQLTGGTTVIVGGVDSVLRFFSTRSALSRFKKELDDSNIALINTSHIIRSISQ